jgi:hypothetical protein
MLVVVVMLVVGVVVAGGLVVEVLVHDWNVLLVCAWSSPV